MKNLIAIVLIMGAFSTASATYYPPKTNSWEINNNNHNENHNTNVNVIKGDHNTNTNTAHGGKGGHGGAGGQATGGNATGGNATGGNSDSTAMAVGEGGRSTVGDLTVTGGDLGDVGSTSNSSSNSSSNSNSNSDSNSESDASNSLNDSGNATVKNIILYPLNIESAQLIAAKQQCSGIYERYNNVSMTRKGIKVIFVTDTYADVTSQAAREGGLLGDSFLTGKPHFLASLLNVGKFKQPVSLVKRMVRRAPKGTKTIIAHINTDCNTRAAGFNVGRGGVTDNGTTQLGSASYGSASNVPYAQLYPMYLSADITISDCAVNSCAVTE